MRIYVAARSSRRAEMHGLVVPRLRAMGHEVTARWVDGAEETLGESAAGALMDVEDIEAADMLLFFAEPRGSLNVGGGRHWEFGYAFARGKSCVVVGDRETIFCHLPSVRVIATLGEF